jgi:hypothetical protein
VIDSEHFTGHRKRCVVANNIEPSEERKRQLVEEFFHRVAEKQPPI